MNYLIRLKKPFNISTDMIGKIPKPGRSFKGLLEYNLMKKEATILDADGIRIDKIAHTITDFNMQRKMNPNLGQAVGHIALSWSINDLDKLNDEVMTTIAKEFLQKMKILNTQVLIVRHQDKGHPHLHIIYNRVDNKGKTIPDHFQHIQNIKVTKELTLKHGFFLAESKQQVNRQALKGADKIRYELFDTIKAESKLAGSMDDLKDRLRARGIELQYKYKSGTDEVQGISFVKGSYKFKGSKIDRSLSHGRLSEFIRQNVIRHEATISQGQPLQRPEYQPKGAVPLPSHGRSLIDVLLKPEHVEAMPHDWEQNGTVRKRKKKKGSAAKPVGQYRWYRAGIYSVNEYIK